MQPCSREMQSLNSLLLQDLHMSSSDDFLEQILASSSAAAAAMWDPNAAPSLTADAAFAYDDHSTLASKFRNHQITSKLPWQHLPDPSSLLQIPLSLPPNDAVDAPSFKSGGETSVQALYNGFTGSLPPSNHAQHFQPPQTVASAAATNQPPPCGAAGAAPAQPRQRVRARRGQATDPHSIAERLRRERIAERMKALQELVPNANKTDKASMLDEIIDYVKFLQVQVKVLSMSRLGGAAAVVPLVADIASEGGGDCIQANANSNGAGALPRNSTTTQTTTASTSNDSLTMTEHQVAKLMEEDMGSAMQYLQGKGLCLMPISLATAISTATCHTRNPLINHVNASNTNPAAVTSHCDGPSSPNMSVLTVQSAVKDAASVSKPSG